MSWIFHCNHFDCRALYYVNEKLNLNQPLFNKHNSSRKQRIQLWFTNLPKRICKENAIVLCFSRDTTRSWQTCLCASMRTSSCVPIYTSWRYPISIIGTLNWMKNQIFQRHSSSRNNTCDVQRPRARFTSNGGTDFVGLRVGNARVFVGCLRTAQKKTNVCITENSLHRKHTWRTTCVLNFEFFSHITWSTKDTFWCSNPTKLLGNAYICNNLFA